MLELDLSYLQEQNLPRALTPLLAAPSTVPPSPAWLAYPVLSHHGQPFPKLSQWGRVKHSTTVIMWPRIAVRIVSPMFWQSQAVDVLMGTGWKFPDLGVRDSASPRTSSWALAPPLDHFLAMDPAPQSTLMTMLLQEVMKITMMMLATTTQFQVTHCPSSCQHQQHQLQSQLPLPPTIHQHQVWWHHTRKNI